MSLVYFLPGKRAVSAQDAEHAGLAYAVDGQGPTHSPMERGPGGASGVVFSFPAVGREISLPELAGAAQWSRVPDSEAWVGYDPQKRPRPADLARAEVVRGYWVELGDRQEWLIPVARCYGGGTELPCRFAWDGARWAQAEVKDRYRELYGAARMIWDNFGSDEDLLGNLSDKLTVCAWALAVNYRLGPAEISLLGIFDQPSAVRIARALIDWPTLAEWAKKKLAAPAASSAPGGGG